MRTMLMKPGIYNTEGALRDLIFVPKRTNTPASNCALGLGAKIFICLLHPDARKLSRAGLPAEPTLFCTICLEPQTKEYQKRQKSSLLRSLLAAFPTQ